MRAGIWRGRSRNWKGCLRLMWAVPVRWGRAWRGRGGATGAGVACSCGPPQGISQRFDAGRLRFDQPELADVIAELVQDLLRPDRAGQFAVAADQPVQVLAVVLEALGADAVDVDQR